MRPTLAVLFAASLSSICFPALAHGQIVAFEASLDPFQEVPPHNTPGYGSADLSLDTTTGVVTISPGTGIYADLLAGASTVRFQDAIVGANGPTLALFTLDTPGNTSGTFSGNGSSALTPTQMNDMMDGNTYLNITDAVFPSGEIRGQVLPVPEPGSLAFLSVLGLFALGRRGRRRPGVADYLTTRT
jgi:hypothetical protein